MGIPNTKSAAFMLTTQQAEQIVTALLEPLSGAVRAHINPETYQRWPEGHAQAGEYITGMSAFCRAYGIDRTNLTKCLPTLDRSTPTRRISVGLFQRIAVALGHMRPENLYMDAELQNLSLVSMLKIDGFAVRDAVMIITLTA